MKRIGLAKALIGFAIVWLWPVAASATTAQEAFDQANASYEKGDFAEAVRLYESCLSGFHVVNEHLYYNLGNAYYKLSKMGPAIYNYERALKVDPGMEDARHNLKVARKVTKAKGMVDVVVGAAREPFWVRAVTGLTPGVESVLFLVLWYATFVLVLLLFYLKRGAWRVGVISGAGLFFVASLLSGLLLGGRGYYDRKLPQGVVLDDVTVVREGPRENAAAAFRVHAGLKVRLLESDVEWYKIALRNGLEGWVKRRQVGKL
ncbi:MAG: SH3 domain-containing protein [Deltaproteobacteria bacterium]|nr:SH3 domain-containing protein [Deltaproteobacteria bacterium]